MPDADDARMDRMERAIDRALDEVSQLRRAVERLVVIEEQHAPTRTALVVDVRTISERLARVEGSVAALTDEGSREERSARRWDVWIGPDGYLRSRAFLAALALVGIALGAITAEQLVGWWSGLAPVLVPQPTPP